MRRSIYFLFALVFAPVGATAACASSPASPTQPAVVTLAPGESSGAGGLTVKFIRVTADSRCPGDAVCIQAGDAQVATETTVLGSTKAAELYLVDPAKRTITHGGYTITFDALTPYPFLSLGPIAPSAYRATFKITRQ